MKLHNKFSAGFTFIELITVVAIMILIGSVTLFKHSKFSSDILITNAAYEVALSIRQVEVFGLSSKGVGSQYRAGYGIHLNPSLALGEYTDGRSSYATFFNNPSADYDVGENADFTYQYSDDHQLIDRLMLSQGQKIVKYCARNSSTRVWECWSSPTLNDSPDISHTVVPTLVMNIVFVKPNPEAHITVGNIISGNIYSYNASTYDKAKIVVQSTLGDKCRSISVSVSGQISVDPINPNDANNGCNPQLL